MKRCFVVAVVTAFVLSALVAPAASAQGRSGNGPVAPAAHGKFARVCGDVQAGHVRCHSLVRIDILPLAQSQVQQPAQVLGYHPSDLQSAYSLPGSSAGSGQTVAIVDAYDDPKAETDLATYRSEFGLPACTTANGCFRKVDQTGGTRPPARDSGWSEEISLDLDMVSAICPKCHILLVESNTNSFTDMGQAVNTAANLGANAISNSYGAYEYPGESGLDSYYNHPGIAVTVSTGDWGYGVSWPAASPYVTAVGGTSLVGEGGRGWVETAWSGAGSGCSAYEPRPAWQTNAFDPLCAMRTVADVSAVADPNTGVAVFDSFFAGGWMVFGGTSVSSPIIASVYALAGNAGTVTNPKLAANGYGYGSYPYSRTNALWDITSGSNGGCGTYLCTAGRGYDGPTGLGTPDGTAGF